MLPAPFLSKWTPRQVMVKEAIPPEHEDEKNHEVHEFHQIMEEVKAEFPDLSAGAQQKLALERCAKKNEEQRLLLLAAREKSEKRFSLPDVIQRGAEDILSKLHLGKHGSFGDVEDGIGSTVWSSAQASSTEREKRAPIAVKQSVAIPMEQQLMMLHQMDMSESDNESLQDSLDNIERSASAPDNNNERSPLEKSPQSRRSRRTIRNSSIRHSRRLSGLSTELSDVEEDEESTSNESDPADNVSSSPKQGQQQNPGLVSDILPNEIAVVLDSRDKVGKKDKKVTSSVVPGRRRNQTGRGVNLQRSKAHTSLFKSMGNESHNSSFLSVDSANFQGDFWAWRSVSSKGSTSDA